MSPGGFCHTSPSATPRSQRLHRGQRAREDGSGHEWQARTGGDDGGDGRAEGQREERKHEEAPATECAEEATGRPPVLACGVDHHEGGEDRSDS